MPTIDLSSGREVHDIVNDTVRDAALTALDNLADLGLAIYGAGIVNNERRLEFATVADQGRTAVRDAAAELATTIADSGADWWAEHDGCEMLQVECGDALQALGAKLGRITDETERGWLYGDGLVRTLANLTRAVDNLADSVITERDATGGDKAIGEITLYLAPVPVELAAESRGMVGCH